LSEKRIDDKIVLGLECVQLAPRFEKEVLDDYEAWEGRETAPMRLQEPDDGASGRSLQTLQRRGPSAGY
jgi:hypothetical protein